MFHYVFFFFHSNVVINDLFIEIQVMINYILTYIHKIFKGKKNDPSIVKQRAKNIKAYFRKFCETFSIYK